MLDGLEVNTTGCPTPRYFLFHLSKTPNIAVVHLLVSISSWSSDWLRRYSTIHFWFVFRLDACIYYRSLTGFCSRNRWSDMGCVHLYKEVGQSRDKWRVTSACYKSSSKTRMDMLLIAHLRYVKILSWSRGFIGSKLQILTSSIISQFPEGTWEQRKPNQI